MAHSISIETTSVDVWNHLLSLQIDGVTLNRVIQLSEGSKVRLLAAFASGVAVNLFSSALYDVLKNFPSHETTINGKQVPGKQVQIGELMNSQVQINQSSPKAECDVEKQKSSHDTKP